MPRSRPRLRFEPLEDRTVPTAITVTTAADVVDANDGLTSLREAINDVNAATSPPGFAPETVTISFIPELAGATLTLSQIGDTTFGPAAFGVRNGLTIQGRGQKFVRATDAPNMRLFNVMGTGVGQYGTLSLRSVELLGGYSDGFGGAIYSRGGYVLLNQSLLADNSAAGAGGAIYSFGGGVQAVSSTFTNNTARPGVDGTSRGGAIAKETEPSGPGAANVAIAFSTLVGNTASQGAQVYVTLAGYDAGVSVNWSILYTPQPAGGGVDDLLVSGDTFGAFGADRRGGNNLIGSVAGSEWGVVSTADPQLGPLQDNGGPTRSMLPQPGSPAIDRANNAPDPTHFEGFYSLQGFRFDIDQRGASRVAVGSAADLGAVEAGNGAVPPANGSSLPVPIPPPPVTLVPPPVSFDNPQPISAEPLPILPPAIFVAPPEVPIPKTAFVVGSAPGAPPTVTIYNADGTYFYSLSVMDYFPSDVLIPGAPAETSFTGGVSAALADVTGDGNLDVIVAAGAGGGPRVQVFDGATYQEIRSFFAYDPSFSGGVNLAAGDVNGDGIADIVTGAGAGGGPHVKMFDGKTGAEVRSFFAYDLGFRGGVNVAVAEEWTVESVSNSTQTTRTSSPGDIVTGAGAGGGSHVKTFHGETGAMTSSFMAFDPAFRGGVDVAAMNTALSVGLLGDGRGYPGGNRTASSPSQLVVAQAGNGSKVSVFHFGTDQLAWSFNPFDGFLGGARLAARDLDGNGFGDLIVGAGESGGPRVRFYAAGWSQPEAKQDFLVGEASSRGGANVG